MEIETQNKTKTNTSNETTSGSPQFSMAKGAPRVNNNHVDVDDDETL